MSVATAPNGATTVPTAPMTHAAVRVAMPVTKTAAGTSTPDTWLQVIWAKLRQAANQVAQVVLRFVDWAKNGITKIAGSPLTLSSVGTLAVLATERGYHGVVNILEGVVGFAGKALDWAIRMIGRGLSFVTRGISWLLHKLSESIGDRFDGLVMLAQLGYSWLTDKVDTFVTAGFSAMHSEIIRQVNSGVSVIALVGVLVNAFSGGWLSTTTAGAVFGIGAMNIFNPLGALLLVGSALLGSLLGGGFADMSFTAGLKKQAATEGAKAA